MSETTVHVSILLNKIVEELIEGLKKGAAQEPNRNIYFLDCTLGGGGHTAALMTAIDGISELSQVKFIGVDQDAEAIERAQIRFSKEILEQKMMLIHSKMSEISNEILSLPIYGVLADLGFSSDQIDSPERGLSFQKDGPLDMRLDASRGQPLRERLMHISESEMADIIFNLGEERFSRQIAKALFRAKTAKRFPSTTLELADLIRSSVPPAARHGRIHPATRTFQAFRIWINQELEELDSLLERVILSLRPGGRAAVLSFHSLEDRKVKNAFRNQDEFRVVTKKPIEADEDEIRRNPRARSAKLRESGKI